MNTRHPDPNRCCAFCGKGFVRQSHLGRPPLYCRANCRRRAHELRRGVWPPLAKREEPPIRDIHPDGLSLNDYDGGYCRGGVGTPGLGQIQHALRPGGFPDHYRLRPTVCGALARPSRMPFLFREGFACMTCTEITRRYRRPAPLGPGADLALIEATIDRAQIIDVKSTKALRDSKTNHRHLADVLHATMAEVLRALRPQALRSERAVA